MSVRKRKWVTKSGQDREVWIVAYGKGKDRHIKTFERKKDADEYHAEVSVDKGRNPHRPEQGADRRGSWRILDRRGRG